MSGDDAPADSYSASSFEPTPGYTQTRYDPGTMSRTDVDVVMEDIEQQLSIRPTDERSGKGQSMKLVCLVASLIGAAVAIGVGVSYAKKKNVESTASITLAAAPDYLATLCSPDMIALESGYDKCEDLCEVAVCCFVPESDKMSCLNDNQGVCQEYKSSCENLDAGTGEGSVTDKGKTDDQSGEAPADDAPAEGGVDDNDAGTGKESGNDTDDLKSAIESACKEDVVALPSGKAGCEALCGPSSCCFFGGELSCLSSGINIDCTEYAACDVLHRDDTIGDTGDTTGDTGDVKSETTKQEVDASCKGDAAGTPEGLEQCETICEPGSCCFASGDEYCLSAGIDVDCAHYSSCNVLHKYDNDDDFSDDDEEDNYDEEGGEYVGEGTGYSSPTDSGTSGGSEATSTTPVAVSSSNSPTPPSDQGNNDVSGGTITASKAQVDEACMQDLSDPDWKRTCEEVCLPGQCCHSTPEPSCAQDGQTGIDCDDFKSCAPLYYGSQDSTKSVVDDACSEKNLEMPGGKESCHELCEMAECCFSSGQNTCVSVNCTDYTACSAIMGESDKENEQPGGGENGAVGEDDLEIAEKVIRECSSEKIDSELGRAECEKLCLNHLCCFATENDCKATLGVECIEYAACKNLIDWSEGTT